MTRRTLTALATTILVVASATLTRRAASQSEEDYAGYLGLLVTPAGALAPKPPALRATPGAVGLSVRYGRSSEPFFEPDESFSAVGVGLDIGTRAGVLGFIIGPTFACGGDCEHGITLAADFSANLVTTAASGTGPRLSLGLAPAVGFFKPTGEDSELSVLSLSGGVPVSVTFGGPVSYQLYVVPGFGWARLSGSGDAVSGTRALLGGGVAADGLLGRLGLQLGFQKIFIDRGATQFGAGVRWLAAERPSPEPR